MSDDIIREVRRIRHLISQECGHDVRKIAEYYRKYEEELKRSGRFRFADPRKLLAEKPEEQSAETAAS